MGFWILPEIGSEEDMIRREYLTGKFLLAHPELSHLDPIKMRDNFWHQTRVREWSWALNEVERIAREKVSIRVLDVGSDPIFASLMAMIPGVHVTMHRTWCDVGKLSSLTPTGGVPFEPFFTRHHQMLRILVTDPENEIARPDYDVVTNISVLEHLPGYMWKAWSDWTWDSLKQGGEYLLTLDWLADGKDPIEVDQEWGMSNKAMEGLVRGEPGPWKLEIPDGPRFKSVFFLTSEKENGPAEDREFVCWGTRMLKE